MAEHTLAEEKKTNDESLRIELFIAGLLRWGVIVSFVIVALGIGAVIVTGQTGYQQIRLDDVKSLVQYRVTPEFPSSLSDVFGGLLTLKPYSIIAMGLLVLIAIPVLRVAVSVVAFVLERDWLYVWITTFVLLVLLISFAIGEAGG
jgi:uncharacterized membrane protein